MRYLLSSIVLVSILTPYMASGSTGHTYLEEVQKWRKEREVKLKKPYGWLSLNGLHWLKKGGNLIGSDETNDIHLPSQQGLAEEGVFILDNGVVTFEPADGSTLKISGKVISKPTVIKSDEDENKPDEIRIGRLKLYLIKRTKGLGIRIKDPRSPSRVGFKGLTWYPVKDEFKITGRFIKNKRRSKRRRMVKVPNVLGGKSDWESPGKVEFMIGKDKVSLVALKAKDSLFFIFNDLTRKTDTYPGGRFLYTDLPNRDKRVVIDFNKAYNPPCAMNKFSTCPLPPRGNKLKVAILAGEKYKKNSVKLDSSESK